MGHTNAGHLRFTGQYTQNWTINPATGVASPDGSTGQDYADFLLGQANEWDAGVSPEYGGRLKNPQMFIQDDYKIRPNLTLNLGVRYQIRRGWTEVHGNMATYDPTIVNPAGGPTGAEWYGTTHTNGRTQLEDNKYNTVLPRVGFAWLPYPNMTVRGGFGMYAYNLSLDTYGGGMGNAIAASGNAADQTGVTPITILGGTGTIVGSGAALPYTAASTSPSRFNGQSVGYTQFDTPNPQIYQYNFGIQQGIGSNMVFDIAYVGSHAHNLFFTTNLNQVPTADLALGPNTAQYRPNQNFHDINGSTNNAISNYNSLQVQLNRRLARGLSFGVNYTWAHFMDDQDSSGWGNRSGPNAQQYADAPSNYSNSNFDVRNAFKGLVAYQLPFGHGAQFFNDNWLVDEVLGGFQVSSTMQFTSGNPFSVFSNNSNDYVEPGTTTHPFATYAAGGQLIGVPGGRNAYEWFNPANFVQTPQGQFGNVRRNSLYGPGLELVNISASKRVDIRESVKLQLRLDAFNAFNHTSLGQPNGSLTTSTVSGGTFPGNGVSLNTGVTSGQITSAKVGGRNLQAGIRLEF